MSNLRRFAGGFACLAVVAIATSFSCGAPSNLARTPSPTGENSIVLSPGLNMALPSSLTICRQGSIADGSYSYGLCQENSRTRDSSVFQVTVYEKSPIPPPSKDANAESHDAAIRLLTFEGYDTLSVTDHDWSGGRGFRIEYRPRSLGSRPNSEQYWMFLNDGRVILLIYDQSPTDPSRRATAERMLGSVMLTNSGSRGGGA